MRFKPLTCFLVLLFVDVVLAAPYPMTVFQRPFTIPQNAFQSSLAFGNQQIAQLGFDYGVTDKFQLGTSWGGANPTGLDIDRKISLNAAHFVYTTYRVSAMTNLAVPIHFDRMAFRELSWGMPTFIALYKGHVNLVLLENFFNLKWFEDVRADFHFQTRLSWQATQTLCLNLASEVGTLSTSGKHKHLLDSAPLYLRGLYSVTSLVDIIASAGFDSVQEPNKPSFMLGVLFRGGSIEG